MLGVSLKNYSISFGNTKILENISFDAKQGEIITILGPSGCGKSTILRSIASLEDQYTGDIFVNEHCIINNGKKECHKDIGYIFQDYALFPHLDVKDNIEFALFKLNAKEKQKRVDELLKQFDLFEHRHKQIHELSGGQQQRVSIARVLAYKPKVLLLDEPFSNLDTNLRAKTKVWLKKLIKDLGLSAILVTHDQKEALSFSDKIAIIHNKNISQFGTPKELFNKPNNYYVANFLEETNILPNFIKEELKLESSKKHLLRLNRTKLSNNANKFKILLEDLSYCGDYIEVKFSFEKDSNTICLAKVFFYEELNLDEELYLDLDKNNIISVEN